VVPFQNRIRICNFYPPMNIAYSYIIWMVVAQRRVEWRGHQIDDPPCETVMWLIFDDLCAWRKCGCTGPLHAGSLAMAPKLKSGGVDEEESQSTAGDRAIDTFIVIVDRHH